jgi:hypothetical protein
MPYTTLSTNEGALNKLLPNSTKEAKDASFINPSFCFSLSSIEADNFA